MRRGLVKRVTVAEVLGIERTGVTLEAMVERVARSLPELARVQRREVAEVLAEMERMGFVRQEGGYYRQTEALREVLGERITMRELLNALLSPHMEWTEAVLSLLEVYLPEPEEPGRLMFACASDGWIGRKTADRPLLRLIRYLLETA